MTASADIPDAVGERRHLPECPWPTPPCSHTPLHDRQPLFCIDCLTECICDRLRACEQRVREEDNRALWDQRQYLAGVQAARDAVAAMAAVDSFVIGDDILIRCDALAAIDALRADTP